MIFTLSEGTAARRRFPLYLVDATDGITPETGEAAGQPQISKAGGAWANTTATLTALGNGAYYVELTATELDTLGPIQVRYKSAATAEFNAPGVVVAYDQHNAVRMGLTALPAAAANAAGGLPVSIAGALDLDAQRADVAAVLVDTGTTLDGRIPAALVGGRIDASVGAAAANVITAASIAADAITAAKIDGTAISEIQSGLATASALSGVETKIDTVDTVVDAILVDTGTTLDAAIADLPTNAELATALAAADDAVLAAIGALNNLSAAQVNAEVVDALATDTYAEPGQGAPAATAALSAKINYLYKFLRNKVTQTATTLSVFADDATTVDHKSTVSDDGTTYTRGEIAAGP